MKWITVSIEHRSDIFTANEHAAHEADADNITSGQPKNLAKALEKAVEMLSKRLEKLPESDPLHIWIQNTLEHAEERAETLKTEKLLDSRQVLELTNNKIPNHPRPLWEAYAIRCTPFTCI